MSVAWFRAISRGIRCRPMIDRRARNELALLLRRLVTGQITTDDFDNDRPERSVDPGVVAVSDAAWTSLYSDVWPVRLLGRRRLTDETRSHVARWIVFLKSDTAYEWPTPPSSVQRFISFLSALFVPGSRTALSKWKSQGDFDVWPFLSQADYENALQSPPFLHGSTSRFV
jgi:hypothetical protein